MLTPIQTPPTRRVSAAAAAMAQVAIGSNGSDDLFTGLLNEARSRIRQAEFGLQQARNDLSFTQRQLLADLNSFYREADVAGLQIASLRRSMDLSNDSVKLTLEQYEAGEATALEVVEAIYQSAESGRAVRPVRRQTSAPRARVRATSGRF